MMKPSMMTVSSSTRAGSSRRPARARAAARRSRADKSADTRRRILDATFAALDELGFAGATTSEVCRRARVPRGTLLHHYPTTADLVTAAAEDVFQRRLDAYREAFAALPAGSLRSGKALGLLWQILAGPTYYAWLEIVVASRTDARLRRRLRKLIDRFGATVDETFAAMFPAPEQLPFDPRVVPAIVFPLLNGLAVDRIYADRRRIDEVVATLCHLADRLEIWLYPETQR
jgi:AcrR family transcriptional regulator